MADSHAQLRLLLQEVLNNESASAAIVLAMDSQIALLQGKLRSSARSGHAIDSAWIEGQIRQAEETIKQLRNWARDVTVHRE